VFVFTLVQICTYIDTVQGSGAQARGVQGGRWTPYNFYASFLITTKFQAYQNNF